MYCRNCGTEISDDAKFCQKCGYYCLNETQNESVEILPATELESRYCRNCGTEISDDAKFCQKCGYYCLNETQNESVEILPATELESRYCSKCGEKINKDAVICPKCGCYTNNNENTSNEYEVDKSAMGFVMSLFLGFIGLVIGIALYPTDTLARKTFIKSWLITTCVVWGICFLVFMIVLVSSTPSYSSYY